MFIWYLFINSYYYAILFKSKYRFLILFALYRLVYMSKTSWISLWINFVLLPKSDLTLNQSETLHCKSITYMKLNYFKKFKYKAKSKNAFTRKLDVITQSRNILIHSLIIFSFSCHFFIRNCLLFCSSFYSKTNERQILFSKLTFSKNVKCNIKVTRNLV